MADDHDKSQQTEEPTQEGWTRRTDGDVVKARRSRPSCFWPEALCRIAMFGHSVAEGFTSHFTMFLEQPDQIVVGSAGMVGLMQDVLTASALILAPFFGLLMALAVAGHVLQHRPIFTTRAHQPDFPSSPLDRPQAPVRPRRLDQSRQGPHQDRHRRHGDWTQLWPERGASGSHPGPVNRWPSRAT